ncbi:glycosyltransferase family 4 protein [Leptothoe sp. LEGE 181152]|nr:glycosyltransferase family 4 protein [Leptothoe sp. LEGE 181152]
MKPLRILLVLPSPPLPFGTADGRWYYILLKELVKRKYCLTTFVACKSINEIDEIKSTFPSSEYDIRCYLYNQKSGILGKFKTVQQPYSYIFSQALQKDLKRELSKPFDVLHLEQIWSGWLGKGHESKALLNIHYLFSVDGTFQSPNTLENKFRRLLSCRAERKLLKSFNLISTLTDRLTHSVQQLNPQAELHTVPMGIDLSLYPFDKDKLANHAPTVGLIGNFGWRPSYLAAERLLTRLWPSINEAVPNSRLQIVGRSAKNALGSFIDTPGLEIYQDVPDIIPYFQSTDVLLYAPDSGSGMKVKVMEAFALGTPVVTTQEGVEGLEAEDRVHAGIADDDKLLIARTVEMLTDSSFSKACRDQARKLMEDKFNIISTVSKVESVYEQISSKQ